MNKTTRLGSKVPELLGWLSISETSRHLGIRKPQVLQLALTGHLQLSVRFVNPVIVKRGVELVPCEVWKDTFLADHLGSSMAAAGNNVGGAKSLVLDEWENNFLDKLSLEEQSSLPFKNPKELSPEQQAILQILGIHNFVNYMEEKARQIGGKVINLVGLHENVILLNDMGNIYGLPMIGNERFDVEQKYQQLTDGDWVRPSAMEGTFIEKDGVIYQVQQNRPSWRLLNEFIELKKIEGEAKDALLTQYREDFAKAKGLGDDSDAYYPANTLPDDKELVVLTSDLREFEDRLGLDLREENHAGLPSQASVVEENYFRSEGDYWKIRFKGKPFTVTNTKGMRYITTLIQRAYNNEREIPAEDLYYSVNGHPTIQNPISDRDLLDLELTPASTIDHGLVDLTPQDYQWIRQKRNDLKEEIIKAEKNGDKEKSLQLREKMEVIEDYMKKAYGLGGKRRKTSNSQEKCRKAVERAIARSIQGLALDKNNPLSTYLDRRIKKGYFLEFQKDPQIYWKIFI